MALQQTTQEIVIDVSEQNDSDIKDGPHGQKGRNRGGRLMVFTLSALIILVPYFVLGYVGGILGSSLAGEFIGLGIGWWLLGLLMPRFFIYVPEAQGYVTQQALFGKKQMHAYGPGFHLSYPDEQRNANNNKSLEAITQSFEVTVATKSSAVTLRGKYYYVASLPYLTRTVGVDQTTVETGLTAFIKNFLISSCTQPDRDAEWVLQRTGELTTELNDHFTGKLGGAPEEIERKFGFSTVAVVIDTVSLPEDVQKTRDALAEADLQCEIVARTYAMTVDELRIRRALPKDDTRAISITEYNTMLNRALTISKQMQGSVQIIEGGDRNLMRAAASRIAQSGQGGQS